MLEAVPLRVERRVLESVRAGKVDDDRAGGRLERGRPLVAEAEEDQVRARRRRLVVTREGRQRPVQPHVERRGGRAGERVRAERHDLELRVAERAVERLLARVARGPEDRHRRHGLHITQKIA